MACYHLLNRIAELLFIIKWVSVVQVVFISCHQSITFKCGLMKNLLIRKHKRHENTTGYVQQVFIRILWRTMNNENRIKMSNCCESNRTEGFSSNDIVMNLSSTPQYFVQLSSTNAVCYSGTTLVIPVKSNYSKWHTNIISNYCKFALYMLSIDFLHCQNFQIFIEISGKFPFSQPTLHVLSFQQKTRFRLCSSFQNYLQNNSK
jgi:hypothetical protein